MRYLFNISAILLMILSVSCEKQEQIVGDGTNESINIVLKCARMESAGSTKSLTQIPDEGTGSGYRVKDYWILQYSSSGDFIDESAKYVEVTGNSGYKTPVIMPNQGEAYYCLFIANTHNPNLDTEFDGYKHSLASMTKFYKNISDLEDTYNAQAEEPDLVMSGISKLNYGATELSCKLYRNIAKLTVELKNNEGSDLTIKSINIKNIPGGTLYADAVLKGSDGNPLPGITSAAAPFPDSYSIPYFDYEVDNINVGENTTKSFVWYLPRNLKGIVAEASSADLKNKYAPEHATYIEIFATTSKGALYRYRFYLGENATTDFNVEPNKHYKIPITFVDKGSVLDSRVHDYTSVSLSGNSNSYIINPLPGDDQTIYNLPITRVNEFWGSSDAPSGNNNTIGAQTEWIAEVIWQDQPARLLNFVDANGELKDNFAATGTSGAFSFKVKKGAKGNVLIGVRKASETKYLWSWHLWITDYNPDESMTMPWQENKYIYHVTGGQVHRYAGEFWDTNYKNKYIMDRHLGALSANRKDGLNAAGGFLYQYGRKDPFPYNTIQIYNISGEIISFSGNTANPISILSGPVPMYEAVNNPFSFVTVASGDWASDNAHYKSLSYSWNGATNKKSIFDPCPDGWMVPNNEIWENFGNGTEINMNSNSVMYNSLEAGIEFYLDGSVESAHKYYNIAYYPAAGYRNPSTGVGTRYKTRGYVHSTQAKLSTSISACLDLVLSSPVTVTVTQSSSMARGASVRCIREMGITSPGGNQNDGSNKNEEYIEVPW